MLRTTIPSPLGEDKTIRVVLFKEGNTWVAQCLEFDISAQADGLVNVMDRLQLTVEAEFVSHGYPILPAPKKYWDMWEKKEV